MERPSATALTASAFRPLRVLIADDSEDMLGALSHALSTDPHLDVIGIVHPQDAAVELAARLQPEIVIMSLNVSDLSALETTRRIKAQPNAPLVVLVAIDDRQMCYETAGMARTDRLLDRPILGRGMLALLYRLNRLYEPKQD